MGCSEHYEKDIAFHAATAAEYDDLIVRPREPINELLFEPFRAAIPGGGRMLDLGSGTGHAVLRFGAQFDAVVGVDHSAEMLALAREKLAAAGLGHVVLLRQEMQAFLLGSLRQFDFVTAIGCLHHLPRGTIPALISAVFGVMNPGGRLLIAEPIEVDLSRQPQEIVDWNAKSVAAGRDFSSDVEEADEAPIEFGRLADSLAGAGFAPVCDARAWELFPREMPPSAVDLETIAALHRRHGATGNVLATLWCRP